MTRVLCCPRCSIRFWITSGDLGGERVNCPGCEKRLVVPAAPAAAPAGKAIAGGQPVDTIPFAQPIEESESPLAEPLPPRREAAAAKTHARRHSTNAAVVITAAIAGLAALGWLRSIVDFVDPSLADMTLAQPAKAFLGRDFAAKYGATLSALPFALLACVFVGALFGGMCASSLASVARFRHSLYAGLWLSSLLLMIGAATYGLLHLLSWSLRADLRMASLIDHLQAAADVWMAVFPVVLVLNLTGFLLGGALDELVTAVARGVSSREKWTYHTRGGKSFQVYGPWRNPLIAAVWGLLAWVILFTCWIPLLRSNLLSFLAAFALSRMCWTLAKKHRAMSAKHALTKDQRPPILYLRSFQDDGVFHPGKFILINDWFRTLFEKTTEDKLSRMLGRFGPVVAIGRPEEEIAEVGAARVYVGDDHWKDLVMDLLSDRGALAVLQAGGTRGLKWELEAVGSMLLPEQVMLFLPFCLYRSRGRRDDAYYTFRAWANKSFPAELPRTIDDDEYFFYFTSKPTWKTRVVEMETLVPKAHPLRKVLTHLNTSNTLRPWRLTNWRRFWLLWFAVLLVFAMSQLDSLLVFIRRFRVELQAFL